MSTKYKTIIPSTNKIRRGKSIKVVSLKITRKIPISAGPINAAAFPNVLNNPNSYGSYNLVIIGSKNRPINWVNIGTNDNVITS